MASLFGGKKARQPKMDSKNLNDTIISMRQSIETLEKREQHLAKQIEKCIRNAKTKFTNKDKNGALLEIKRKKIIEKEASKMAGQKLNLEQQVFALEEAFTNQATYKAMKTGQKVMSAVVKKTDVDKIGDLMDDISNSISDADQINEALSNPIGDIVDDDELEKELAELEQDEREEDILSGKIKKVNVKAKEPKINLPSVPTTTKKTEDDEIKELEGLLAS